MASLEVPDRLPPGWLQRPGLRQFIKFCLVGLSSTLISAGLFSWFVYGIHLDRLLLAWLQRWPSLQHVADQFQLYIQVAALIAFAFAVTNGYFWNSRWTFRQTDREGERRRFVKFVLVNIVGLVLNQIIVFLVNAALTAGRPRGQKGLAPLIAFGVATCIVVFWNFLANKHWTFKS